MHRLDELIAEHSDHYSRSPQETLLRLRVPTSCAHLKAVLVDVESALLTLCDFNDSPLLIETRDVVRELLAVLRINKLLSDDSLASIDAAPAIDLDIAYRALPSRLSSEPWWRQTLRESLLIKMLLSPDADGIPIVARALQLGIPIAHDLFIEQKSPTARMELLIEYLKILAEKKYSDIIVALEDTVTSLSSLPKVRSEKIAPENLSLIKQISMRTEMPVPSAREKLHRLARDIGMAAVALRRAHHTPPEQLLWAPEALSEVVRRSMNWAPNVRSAFNVCLLLGRLGQTLLKTNNKFTNAHLKTLIHNTWIERELPPDSDFSRQLSGQGYESVSRVIKLPLPRKLSDALVHICAASEGPEALRNLKRALREIEREKGVRTNLRGLTHLFEFQLEEQMADEALLVLLGMEPRAKRNAAIHYFSPRISAVVDRFQEGIERLVAQANLDILCQGWSVPPQLESAYFGYSYRPELDAIRDLAEFIQLQAQLERGRVTQDRLREAYNARVAKLTLMYLCSTGARPTGSVLPLHSDVSLIDRAVLVSEKDSLGYRSTRIVPLTPRMIIEIEAFGLWMNAKKLGPRPFYPLNSLAMILTQDGEYVWPTVEAMCKHVPGFRERWLWPNDVFRHLFRSRLWEIGCPSDWLRRVMGHYPRHAAADVPYAATPIWEGLHDFDLHIDEQLIAAGF